MTDVKTIEERAAEYEEISGCYGCELAQVKQAFIAGAQSEHALLTEWRSPDDIPDTDRYVLIKINNTGDYAVGYYNGNRDSWHIPSFFETCEFIGWREIQE